MTSFLEQFPLPWHDQRVQELRGALLTVANERPAIVELMLLVGLETSDIILDQPARYLWRDVLNLAAGQLQLPALIAAAVQRYPAIRSKIAELESARPLLAAPMPAPMAVGDNRWKNFGTGQRERQIVAGPNTLLDISFLDRGRRCARAVCRITGSAFSGPFYGTGFRIGELTILTNHHVLYDWDHAGEPAEAIAVEFGYELDLAGRLAESTPISCDPATIQGERDADWAVIETFEPLPDDIPILLLPDASTVTADDRVCIIQHPLGLPKKIALAHNLVRYVDAEVVQYWTDTEAGSSGAPVFDEQWRLVALHHQWVESPEADGTAYRNQGRFIPDVRKRIIAAGITDLGSGL